MRAEVGATVFVVHGSGGPYVSTPLVYGVYARFSHANEARKRANFEHGRTKGTIGAFRVTEQDVQAAPEKMSL